MNKPNEIESVLPLSGRYSFKADFRLNAWLGIATALYCAIRLLLKFQPDWPPVTRSLLTLTPIVPGLLYIRSWFRFIRRMDELQQRIQLQAFLFAALGTVTVGIIVATLNANGYPLADFRYGLGVGGASFTMLVFWTIGTVLGLRRYR